MNTYNNRKDWWICRPECPWERTHKLGDWNRKNLLSSNKGLIITDIDYIYFYYLKKKIILLENKTFNHIIPPWQYKTLELVDQIFKKGTPEGWEYLGLHSSRFEKTSFEDGRAYFDSYQFTEDEYKEMVSLEDKTIIKSDFRTNFIQEN